MDEKLQSLYDFMKSNGVEGMSDFNSFKSDFISNPNTAKSVYGFMKSNGVEGLDSFENFYGHYDVKKKEGGGSQESSIGSSMAGTQQGATTILESGGFVNNLFGIERFVRNVDFNGSKIPITNLDIPVAEGDTRPYPQRVNNGSFEQQRDEFVNKMQSYVSDNRFIGTQEREQAISYLKGVDYKNAWRNNPSTYSDINHEQMKNTARNYGIELGDEINGDYFEKVKLVKKKINEETVAKYTEKRIQGKSEIEYSVFDESGFKNDDQNNEVNNLYDRLASNMTERSVGKTQTGDVQYADQRTVAEKFVDYIKPSWNIVANIQDKVQQYIEMHKSKEFDDNFFTGLNQLKLADETEYNRIVKQIQSGEPVASNDYYKLTNKGFSIRMSDELGNLATGKQDVNQFIDNQQRIAKESKELLLNTKDVLKSAISDEIGDVLDASSPVDFIYGSYMYTDKQINDVTPSVLKNLGLDANDPRVAEVLTEIKNDEGWMVGMNGVKKGGLVREFFKGAAQPFRGIVGTLESFVKSDTEIYNEAKNEELAKFTEKRPESMNGRYTQYISDAVFGLGQFASQAGLAYAGGEVVAGLGVLSGVVPAASTAARTLTGIDAAAESIAATTVTGSRVGSALLRSKDYISTFATGYLQSYENNLKQTMYMTDDNNQARMGAFVLSALEGASELILPDVKIGRDIMSVFKKESVPQLLNMIDENVIKKGLDKSLVSKVSEYVGKSLVSSAATIGQEIAEEELVQIGNFAVNAVLNPDQASNRDLADELFKTAAATAVSMSIPALGRSIGGGSYRDHNKGALLLAAKNKSNIEDYLTFATVNNIITKEQASEKRQIINTAYRIAKDVPTKDNGQVLSQNETADYVYSKTREAVLRKDADESKDEVLKQRYNQEIAKEEKFRDGLIKSPVNNKRGMRSMLFENTQQPVASTAVVNLKAGDVISTPSGMLNVNSVDENGIKIQDADGNNELVYKDYDEFKNAFVPSFFADMNEFATLNPKVNANPIEYSRRLLNEYNPNVGKIANEYTVRNGIADKVDTRAVTSVNPERSSKIAAAYQEMKHEPNNPEVIAAYNALKSETKQQWDEMIANGYKVEIWTGQGEPYQNSKQMSDDVRNNKHLWIPPTEGAFGSDDNFDSSNNLLLEKSGVIAGDTELTYNDMFRAVHDFFGHAHIGNQFGAIGEENAWRIHSKMYSPLARRAMTTETRGQNSWVNFSGVNNRANNLIKEANKLDKESRDSNGNIIDANKFSRAVMLRKEGQLAFKFADQKNGLLPEEFSEVNDAYNEVQQGLGDVSAISKYSKGDKVLLTDLMTEWPVINEGLSPLFDWGVASKVQISFRGLRDTEGLAFYNYVTDEIFFNVSNPLFKSLTVQEAQEVVAHELIHKAAHTSFKENEDMRNQFNGEVAKVLDYLKNVDRSNLDEQTKFYVDIILDENSDPQEFITYAVTNPYVANWFASLPYQSDQQENKTVWQWLKEKILRFVSNIVKGQSVLDEANRLLDKYVGLQPATETKTEEQKLYDKIILNSGNMRFVMANASPEQAINFIYEQATIETTFEGKTVTSRSAAENVFGADLVAEVVAFVEAKNSGLGFGAVNDDERGRIETEAKANGTYLKAPNGKDTKLSAENWTTVRTKAFKDWFGDWENDPASSSKIVDDNGEPLVMYHASDAKFSEFDRKKIDKVNTGAAKGFHFTSSEKSAKRYGKNMYASFLNARKPKIGFMESQMYTSVITKDMDGWVNRFDIDEAGSAADVVVYDPNQIMVIDNTHPAYLFSGQEGKDGKPARLENESAFDYAKRVKEWYDNKRKQDDVANKEKRKAAINSKEERSYIKDLKKGVQILRKDITTTREEFNKEMGVNEDDMESYVASLQMLIEDTENRTKNKTARLALKELRKQYPKRVTLTEISLMRKQWNAYKFGYQKGFSVAKKNAADSFSDYKKAQAEKNAEKMKAAKDRYEKALADVNDAKVKIIERQKYFKDKINQLLEDVADNKLLSGGTFNDKELLRLGKSINSVITDKSFVKLDKFMSGLIDKTEYLNKVKQIGSWRKELAKLIKSGTLTGNDLSVMRSLNSLSPSQVSDIDTLYGIYNQVIQNRKEFDPAKRISDYSNDGIDAYVKSEQELDLNDRVDYIVNRYEELLQSVAVKNLEALDLLDGFDKDVFSDLSNAIKSTPENLKSYKEKVQELNKLEDAVRYAERAVDDAIESENIDSEKEEDIISLGDLIEDATTDNKESDKNSKRVVLEELALSNQESIDLDDPALSIEQAKMLNVMKNLDVTNFDADTLRLFMNVIQNVYDNSDNIGFGIFKAKYESQRGDEMQKWGELILGEGYKVRSARYDHKWIKVNASVDNFISRLANNSEKLKTRFVAVTRFGKVRDKSAIADRDYHESLEINLANILKKNKIGVDDIDVQARLALYSWLMQNKGGTLRENRAELKRRLGEVVNDIQVKEKAGKSDKLEADIERKIFYEMIGKINNTAGVELIIKNEKGVEIVNDAALDAVSTETIAASGLLSDGEKEIYNLYRENYDAIRPAFTDVIRQYQNKELVMWNNYMKDTFRNLNGDYVVGSFSKPSDGSYFASSNALNMTADSAIDRVSGNRITALDEQLEKLTGEKISRGINLNFFKNQSENVRSMMMDIHTLEDRSIAEEVFNNSDFIATAGGIDNVQLAKEFMTRELRNVLKIRTDRTSDTVAFWNSIIKPFSQIAVNMQLADAGQYIKQAVSQLAGNAFVDLSLKGSSLYPVYAANVRKNSQDARDLIARSLISKRSDTRGGTNIYGDKNLGDLNERIQKKSIVGKARDKFLEGIKKKDKYTGEQKQWATWFLQAGDTFGAEVSWLAYYAHHLVKNKFYDSFENIDWAKESSNPNADASAFAQDSVANMQNVTSSASASSFISDKNATLARALFGAFGSFAMNKFEVYNQSLRVLLNKGEVLNEQGEKETVSAEQRSEEKKEALQRFAAAMSEDLFYGLAVKMAFFMGKTALADLIIGMLGAGDEEEEKKKRSARKQKDYRDKVKQLAWSWFANTAFSWTTSEGQDIIQSTINDVVKTTGGEGVFYEQDGRNLGTITAATQNFWKDAKRIFQTSIHNYDETSEKDKMVAMVAMLSNVAQASGMNFADLNRVVHTVAERYDRAILQDKIDVDKDLNDKRNENYKLTIANGVKVEFTDEEKTLYDDSRKEYLNMLPEQVRNDEAYRRNASEFAKAKVMGKFGKQIVERIKNKE